MNEEKIIKAWEIMYRYQKGKCKVCKKHMKKTDALYSSRHGAVVHKKCEV
jgi:hypothetical protein